MKIYIARARSYVDVYITFRNGLCLHTHFLSHTHGSIRTGTDKHTHALLIGYESSRLTQQPAMRTVEFMENFYSQLQIL